MAAPLRSGHHLQHGRYEVFAGDSDGVDVQDKFLRRGVDLRVAATQSAKGGFGTHSFNVSATVT